MTECQILLARDKLFWVFTGQDKPELPSLTRIGDIQKACGKPIPSVLVTLAMSTVLVGLTDIEPLHGQVPRLLRIGAAGPLKPGRPIIPTPSTSEEVSPVLRARPQLQLQKVPVIVRGTRVATMRECEMEPRELPVRLPAHLDPGLRDRLEADPLGSEVRHEEHAQVAALVLALLQRVGAVVE